MRLLLSFLFLSLTATCFSQSSSNVPKKKTIGNSGCSVYMYCDTKYDVTFSEDSSQVFTGECTAGDVIYGVICVKLLRPLPDLDVAEQMMISYVDYLKSEFEITKWLGYGKGHHLNNNENTRGIMDYWSDKELDNWKVKAWTDGRYIGFLYTYSKKELSEGRANLFLDSFRLPE